MSGELKLYIPCDESVEHKIKKFNKNNDTIVTTGPNLANITDIGFNELQLSIIVELKITDKDYIYINPYTGKFINTTDKSTENFNHSKMTWTKDKWLKNWSDKNSRINIHFAEITLPEIRVIWCEVALKRLIENNDEFRRMLRNQFRYKIDNGYFLHESCINVHDDTRRIIEEQKTLITQERVPKEKQIVITSGSQAAGKSTFLDYRGGTDESIAEYEGHSYYVVDSDRYLEQFGLAKALNKIPLTYINYRGRCVNSLKELTDKLKYCYGGKDPHKHIEYVLEQWMLERDYNFIKQGTQLWLNHMMENAKYNDYNKTILFIWIAKPQMEERLIEDYQM